MIQWSLEAFRAAPSVRAIVVAAPPGHSHELGGAADLSVLDGGATRAESVANTLAVVETELVAIHDAARPLLTTALIEALVDDLERDEEAVGAIAAAPVTDTIKRAAESRGSLGTPRATKEPRVLETLDRSELWAAQTPQVFRTEALREAIASSPPSAVATDEALLVEAAGGTVLLHQVTEPNLKVTSRDDLRLAELLLAER
jgi:2-C-methyl-D-erythritol 4-phosphate cytidylyltransferase